MHLDLYFIFISVSYSLHLFFTLSQIRVFIKCLQRKSLLTSSLWVPAFTQCLTSVVFISNLTCTFKFWGFFNIHFQCWSRYLFYRALETDSVQFSHFFFNQFCYISKNVPFYLKVVHSVFLWFSNLYCIYMCLFLYHNFLSVFFFYSATLKKIFLHGHSVYSLLLEFLLC